MWFFSFAVQTNARRPFFHQRFSWIFFCLFLLRRLVASKNGSIGPRIMHTPLRYKRRPEKKQFFSVVVAQIYQQQQQHSNHFPNIDNEYNAERHWALCSLCKWMTMVIVGDVVDSFVGCLVHRVRCLQCRINQEKNLYVSYNTASKCSVFCRMF